MLAGSAPDRIEVTVEGSSRVRLDGVVVHQSAVWGARHVTTAHGIPVTSVARTLCDLAIDNAPRFVERAVDDSLRRKLVALHELRRVADELDGQGRSRCTVMRALLEARMPGFDPGGSAQEVRVVRLLVAAGLPAPVPQHTFRIGGRAYRTDLAYVDQGVVIEYDGWDFHRGRAAFDGDRARGNQLELLGLTVLRFTSSSTDAQMVADVRAALARSPAKFCHNWRP
jgi:hypothetical protein